MGATPVCQIASTGCIRPDFATVLSYFKDAYRAIYGQDVYLEPDSQDGQFLGSSAVLVLTGVRGLTGGGASAPGR